MHLSNPIQNCSNKQKRNRKEEEKERAKSKTIVFIWSFCWSKLFNTPEFGAVAWIKRMPYFFEIRKGHSSEYNL